MIGEDGAAIAVAGEAGKPAGVIKMSVSEDGVVDRFRIDREGFPVAFFELLGTLEDAAIDKKAFAGGFDEIFGAGDTASGAEEREFGHGG